MTEITPGQKRKRGRPCKEDGKKRHRIYLSLPDDVIKTLREVGDGSASEGVTILARQQKK